MTTKLFLFDLDGTLLLSGGAGMIAMEQAFMELYALPNAFDQIHPDGKIDPAIFREIIQTRGVKVDDEDAAIKQLSRTYIAHLKPVMATTEKAEIMPGIPALLEALNKREQLHLGLVTGNLEQGAYLKLGRFDLNRYFSFGAFGSDHEDRAELVRIAVSRAEKKFEKTIPMGKNIFVIGDTPRDIFCGKDNGATTVGVATANYTSAQLADAGADFVFENFADTGDVMKRLLG